jgi:glycosyltransferase involved in cell wall biosynthesis
MRVLMLSPEPPYPLNGGGAFRTASLLHYFARFAQVDLILISESGRPALLPPGLVREQKIVPLSHHNRGVVARYIRNARRAIRGVPPLIDRLCGLSAPIERALAELEENAVSGNTDRPGNVGESGHRYDLGIVEHFWCAPYVEILTRYCAKTVLNMHNVESMLHQRYADLPGTEPLVRAGHRRFAAASRKLESALLPRYSVVLAASEEDAQLARQRAPEARVQVYPNSLPRIVMPQSLECPRLVFSANFEYHANIDAVRFLVNEIWPIVLKDTKRLHPDLRLRLVGRGDQFIRHLLPLPENTGIEVTGPVDDALTEIAQARIVVAPLRAGSGTRIKILEAWAAARCVVATPLAAEGLDARDEVNIALEFDPGLFAARIVRLLDDDASRQRLAVAGRHTFEDLYSWEAAWKSLDLNLQLTLRSGLDRYTGGF